MADHRKYQRIALDISGTKFFTCMEILRSDPKSVFCSIEPNEHGDIIFFRKPEIFAIILDHLMGYTVDLKQYDAATLSMLLQDCEFFHIDSLSVRLIKHRLETHLPRGCTTEEELKQDIRECRYEIHRVFNMTEPERRPPSLRETIPDWMNEDLEKCDLTTLLQLYRKMTKIRAEMLACWNIWAQLNNHWRMIEFWVTLVCQICDHKWPDKKVLKISEEMVKLRQGALQQAYDDGIRHVLYSYDELHSQGLPPVRQDLTTTELFQWLYSPVLTQLLQVCIQALFPVESKPKTANPKSSFDSPTTLYVAPDCWLQSFSADLSESLEVSEAKLVQEEEERPRDEQSPLQMSQEDPVDELFRKRKESKD